MPANPRSAEDRLTTALSRTLDHPELLSAFWKCAAPNRLHGLLPEQVKAFSQLGPCKPDLLFFRRRKPTLYVEAKLGAQTEPLQLIRARSQIRRNGGRDDQIVLICDCIDRLPEEIGWRGNALPVRALTWHEVCDALRGPRKMTAPAAEALASFELVLSGSPHAPKNKIKTGLRSSFGHPFGEVMHDFYRHRQGANADFVYGGRIAPRLCYGFPRWKECLQSNEFERIWLFYGPDGRIPENYRAQLILWHTSDIAGSEASFAPRWALWRQALLSEPLAEFEWGSRHHRDRNRGAPPTRFPNSMVGLVNLPTSQIDENAIRRLDRTQLLVRLNKMVEPLERILDGVALNRKPQTIAQG